MKLVETRNVREDKNLVLLIRDIEERFKSVLEERFDIDFCL